MRNGMNISDEPTDATRTTPIPAIPNREDANPVSGSERPGTG